MTSLGSTATAAAATTATATADGINIGLSCSWRRRLSNAAPSIKNIFHHGWEPAATQALSKTWNYHDP